VTEAVTSKLRGGGPGLHNKPLGWGVSEVKKNYTNNNGNAVISNNLYKTLGTYFAPQDAHGHAKGFVLNL